MWQGLLIATLLFAVNLLVRQAKVRYVLACMAMLLLLLLPAFTFYSLRNPSPVQIAEPLVKTTEPNPEVLKTNLPVIQETPEIEVSQELMLQATQPARVSFNLKAKLTNWIPFLVGAWLVGVILLTLRLLLQWVYAERLKHKFTKPVSKDLQNLLLGLTMRLNISRPVQLLESVKVEVPTVIGFLKPVILLPASSLMGLSSSQLEAILAHELAHIRRHDYLINLLQSMVETLFFYNPAVWWVSNRISIRAGTLL